MHNEPLVPQQSEDLPSENIPAAVQWMKDMADHSRPAPAEAASRSASLSASLAKRQQRIMESLQGSEKLLPGLDTAATEALLDWGEALAWVIVEDTSGLDDPAAEDILQPRARALRRLLQRIGTLIANPGENNADAADYLDKQYRIACGDRYRPPEPSMRMVHGRDGWPSHAGDPLQQIADVRCYFERDTV